MVFKEKGRFFVSPLGVGAETRLTYGANDVHFRKRSCLPREGQLRVKTCIAILKRHTNHPKYVLDETDRALSGVLNVKDPRRACETI